MITLNFEENIPNFGTLTYDEKKIKTKDPSRIFAEQKKEEFMPLLNMKCTCGNPTCTNKISFFYEGLDLYGDSKKVGIRDDIINILTCQDTKNAGNVKWNPTEENIVNFVSFSKTVREAILFKQKLLDGLYAELMVSIKGYSEIQIIVRKEKFETLFILFEIPKDFPKVPLYSEAPSYRECLGIIGTLPTNIDTSKIKNDYADMRNPFFEPVIKWIELLGKENNLDLEIQDIWGMPK